MLSYWGQRFVLGLLVGALLSVPAGAGHPQVAWAQLSEPVTGEVVDRFRPPEHIGAPGNRGWEYRMPQGSPVTAASDGLVVFAGAIGGRLYVSIGHRDGLRTTYSWLQRITVARGQRVARGTLLGSSGEVFHFGARQDGAYVDPARLFGQRLAPAVRLVPRSSPRMPVWRGPR